MATQTILLKRGLITNINSASLQEGEAAIAYNAEKSSAQIYVGGAEGIVVLREPFDLDTQQRQQFD